MTRHQHQRGFTIVEILTVVAIISVLLGLLIPVLSGIKGSARLGGEQTAARQMFAAYAMYATSNRDHVMPGYLSGLPARDENGAAIGPIAAARYPWRLAPFLDYQVDAMFVDEGRETLDRMRAQPDREAYVYGVSLLPSLALNATWLGGSQAHAGFVNEDGQVLPNPLYGGRFFLTSLAEAVYPDQLLVFASARSNSPLPGYNQDAFIGIYQGYHEVTSPYLAESGGYLWVDEYREATTPSEFGFLSFRHAGEAVTQFVDGHVDALTPDQLKDMRHWAPRADREDWALD